MTCEELVAYLSAYLDDELDEDLTREAQQHLATCQNCQIVLNTTQRTILLGRDQRRQLVPADQRGLLFDRVWEALLRQPPR
jgi:anti-sigma factor RsiW